MSTPPQHSSPVVPSSKGSLAVAESVVLDVAQTVLTRLASSSASALQDTPASPTVPEVPREYSAEISAPSEVPPEPTIQAPTPTSSHGGHALASGGITRGPRSYPTLPEAIHPRRRTHFPGDLYRRSVGYPDSEIAWNAPSERDPVRVPYSHGFAALNN